MINRRQLLCTAVSTLFACRLNANSILPRTELSKVNIDALMNWPEFQSQMTELAEAYASANINQQQVIEQGQLYLKQLDINSAEFKRAVEESYESGNHYWLWQRLVKGKNINGGILNINSNQPVQLHDHPGASGILRIISGETEVWQFDEVKAGAGNTAAEQEEVELVRTEYRILKPGDMALLTPGRGNIHTLRAMSRQCRMLDFFIPPYIRSQRSWYEPVANNWFDKEKIACRKIPQHAFSMA